MTIFATQPHKQQRHSLPAALPKRGGRRSREPWTSNAAAPSVAKGGGGQQELCQGEESRGEKNIICQITCGGILEVVNICIIITWKQRCHRPPTRPEWEGGRREGKVRKSGMEGIKMTMVEVQVTWKEMGDDGE